MIENISIPVVLNGKTCRINVQRKMFSNVEDIVTIVWYGDDKEEIEHCYLQNLPASERKIVTDKIDEYDRELVKKGL
jgi:hypothetical protein